MLAPLLCLLIAQCVTLGSGFTLGGYTPAAALRFRTNLMMAGKATLSPPGTFLDCVKQAKDSVRTALDDGHSLIEVEFPPLPLDYLEDSASSARDIADANTRWAVEFAKSFVDLGKVSIIYPDQPELDDAMKFVEGGKKN
jgi:hypothetical protein